MKSAGEGMPLHTPNVCSDRTKKWSYVASGTTSSHPLTQVFKTIMLSKIISTLHKKPCALHNEETRTAIFMKLHFGSHLLGFLISCGGHIFTGSFEAEDGWTPARLKDFYWNCPLFLHFPRLSPLVGGNVVNF